MTAYFSKEGLMDTEFCSFDETHPKGDSAMYSSAPRSTRHAALLFLVDMSPLRRRALPGMPITALPSTSKAVSRIKKTLEQSYVV